ncbi:MAG TPA: hypothetical protein VFB75_08225 [Burkholderiales bacterium]|nr:hypothetical protein [Burkholderiales bacterium]
MKDDAPHTRLYPAASMTCRHTVRWPFWVAILMAFTGCAQPQSHGGTYGSTHSFRSQQSPERAARCFARNAEEHSSALAAEVTPGEGAARVVVRVKNGVTYATADFRRSGAGSVGSITLMVVSSGRQSDLIDSLTEGC